MSKEIQYKGARLYKCALQVNSCSCKKNFQGQEGLEENTYNQQILEHCRNNDITVIGLADHGSANTSEGLRDHLIQNDIVVFPGFEIASSEKIHMVCLYSEETNQSNLNQFLGQLMGDNVSELSKNPVFPSSLSCEQIAKRVLNDQKGFWYAAHTTGKNGLLKLSGQGDNYVHLWKKHDLVIAIQIPGTVDHLAEPNKPKLNRYSDIIENKNSDYKREKEVVVINAKDVYNPEELAHPASSCQIKMTDAKFQAFKNAFKDPQSRIFLNSDDIVASSYVSVIESIRWQGAGLFEEQSLAFSHNLNAVIGGRGTGKSTLIESIRFVLDLQPRGGNKENVQQIHSQNLKNSQVEIKARCGSQHGESYTISRRFGEAPVVKNKDGQISHMTPLDLFPEIELLGQNEILEIEQSENNKLALLEKFLPDISRINNDIDQVKRKLHENRQNIIVAQNELDAIEQSINPESKLREQEEKYRKLGIQNKLKNSTLLKRESQISERAHDQFGQIETWIHQYPDLFDLNFLKDNYVKGLPNEKLILDIRGILEQLKTSLDSLVNTAMQGLEKAKSEYESKYQTWETENNKAIDQLHQAIAQLPDHEGKSGKEIGAHYKEITEKLVSIALYKNEHTNQNQLIQTLKSERQSLLESYRDTAFKRYDNMNSEMEKLNQEKLLDKVKIEVSRCKNIENLKKFMQSIDGIGEGKIRWLDDIDDPIDLVQWAKWIEDDSSADFLEKYKKFGVTSSITKRLFAIDLGKRLELEEVELKDTVNIKLNISHKNEAEKKYVAMENLSIGQKCTAILNLLLIKLGDPLIIDQPEDHLDNAFIAERIVKDLRSHKSNRQFIFATHNANIPVFGDAELIVVLKSERSKSVLEGLGSIDVPNICDHATQILEGGKAAFDMRKERYGL